VERDEEARRRVRTSLNALDLRDVGAAVAAAAAADGLPPAATDGMQPQAGALRWLGMRLSARAALLAATQCSIITMARGRKLPQLPAVSTAVPDYQWPRGRRQIMSHEAAGGSAAGCSGTPTGVERDVASFPLVVCQAVHVFGLTIALLHQMRPFTNDRSFATNGAAMHLLTIALLQQ